MIKTTLLIILILLAATCRPVMAENVRISGKVVDSEDKPVEFATVRLANSAIGTNTNLKGDYTLSVAQRDTIEMIYSCIGFKTVHHKTHQIPRVS